MMDTASQLEIQLDVLRTPEFSLFLFLCLSLVELDCTFAFRLLSVRAYQYKVHKFL